MRKIALLVASVLLAVLGTAGLALAQPPDGAGNGGGNGNGRGNGNGGGPPSWAGQPDCDETSLGHTPGHPACQEEVEEPEPPEGPDCEEDPTHPDCEEPEPPEEPDCEEDPTHPDCPEPEPADCPPAEGTLSGIVQQVSDGLAGGGVPSEVTDVVDDVNCEVVVAIEEAIEL